VARLPLPEPLPGGPLGELLRSLHGLHQRAGWPSTRELARRADVPMSHMSVRDVFVKPKLPSLPKLMAIVTVMARMAPRIEVERTQEIFDELWTKAAEAGPDSPSADTDTSEDN